MHSEAPRASREHAERRRRDRSSNRDRSRKSPRCTALRVGGSAGKFPGSRRGYRGTLRTGTARPPWGERCTCTSCGQPICDTRGLVCSSPSCSLHRDRRRPCRSRSLRRTGRTTRSRIARSRGTRRRWRSRRSRNTRALCAPKEPRRRSDRRGVGEEIIAEDPAVDDLVGPVGRAHVLAAVDASDRLPHRPANKVESSFDIELLAHLRPERPRSPATLRTAPLPFGGTSGVRAASASSPRASSASSSSAATAGRRTFELARAQVGRPSRSISGAAGGPSKSFAAGANMSGSSICKRRSDSLGGRLREVWRSARSAPRSPRTSAEG